MSYISQPSAGLNSVDFVESCAPQVEIRMATCYLWTGKFGQAVQHFQKALDTEPGLQDPIERKKVSGGLRRVDIRA